MKKIVRPNLLQTCLLAATLLALPAVVQAQFKYTTDNGTITITGYTGPGGAVTIPTTINDLLVTSIGERAFEDCTSLTSITIPGSVTTIGDYAFLGCASLGSSKISGSVTNIGDWAFDYCTSLMTITVEDQNMFYSSVGGVLLNKGQTTLVKYPGGRSGSYMIPGGVTSIGYYAFFLCASLDSITIPGSVTNIGFSAFAFCSSLTRVYFRGDAPNFERYFYSYPMFADDPVTVYYLPGSIGWDFGFVPAPVALWLPQVQTRDASFGVRTNQFGFNINWASGQTVVVEASTNIANPVWQPVQTNALNSDSVYFSDPQWTNYPARFYRLCTP